MSFCSWPGDSNKLAETIQQVDELGDTFRRERWALLDISNKCARDLHGGSCRATWQLNIP
jgi:hypothetical protein